MKLNSSPVGLDFQPYVFHRASLAGAIAFFEVLSTHFRNCDPNSSLWLLTKIAGQLLRRIQGGGIVEEVEWVDSFLQAQKFFDSMRSLVSCFETKQRRLNPDEQAVSRSN